MPDKPNPVSDAAPPATGGVKAWIPLVITIVAMPALAYGTMQMLILPKMRQALTVSAAEPGADEGAETGVETDAAGSETSANSGVSGNPRRGTVSVRLDKLVVNVSGTMGTRFLMASITLVGTKPGFKETVEANRDQLMDLAGSTLSSKSIEDLERPGARNFIKTELISVINSAMGEKLVQDVYLPEMAIQ